MVIPDGDTDAVEHSRRDGECQRQRHDGCQRIGAGGHRLVVVVLDKVQHRTV